MSSFGLGLALGSSFGHHHDHYNYGRPSTITTINNNNYGSNGNGYENSDGRSGNSNGNYNNNNNGYNNRNDNGNTNNPPNNNNFGNNLNNNNPNNAGVGPYQNEPNNNNTNSYVLPQPLVLSIAGESPTNETDSTEIIFTNPYLIVGVENLLLYGELHDEDNIKIIIQQDSDGLEPLPLNQPFDGLIATSAVNGMGPIPNQSFNNTINTTTYNNGSVPLAVAQP